MILSPLTNIVQDKVKRRNQMRSLDAVDAFNSDKSAMANFTKLIFLADGIKAKLTLTNDPSKSTVGTVIHQKINNSKVPIFFFSTKLSPTQSIYNSNFSIELLTIYLAIKHFKHILEARSFTIYTTNP